MLRMGQGLSMREMESAGFFALRAERERGFEKVDTFKLDIT